MADETSATPTGTAAPTDATAAPALVPTPTPAAAADETMPSDDEIAQAQAVFQRVNAANAAKRTALLPDIKALIGQAGFAPILADATRLRDVTGMTGPFYAHLNAIAIGMNELTKDVAQPTVA